MSLLTVDLQRTILGKIKGNKMYYKLTTVDFRFTKEYFTRDKGEQSVLYRNHLFFQICKKRFS